MLLEGKPVLGLQVGKWVQLNKFLHFSDIIIDEIKKTSLRFLFYIEVSFK